MFENKHKNKNSRAVLIVLGIFAAYLTFLTITWCIGYPEALASQRENPGMGGSFVGLILGFGLFAYSFFWLIEFCVALVCGVKAKIKAVRIWQIVIAAYAILGLASLWTVFLIVRF